MEETECPERCENCIYFKEKTKGYGVVIGQCIRFPPQVSYVRSEDAEMDWYSFPMVRGSDICGEYLPLEPVAEEIN